MKQYWQRIATKIDGLSVRERAIIFAMAALMFILLINSLLLDPQLAKQKQLTARVKDEQAKIAAMQAEMQLKVKLQTADPDAANRESLQRLKQVSAQMHASLLDMQRQLVSPDKMTDLLESILRQNGQLRLVSLKTLPVTTLNEPATVGNKTIEEKASGSATLPADDKATKATMSDAIYKHGVEITIQGSYSELLNYLAELEGKPWQLFWGKAKLHVDEYPKVTLTLTLFTLSLDRKWLNI